MTKNSNVMPEFLSLWTQSAKRILLFLYLMFVSYLSILTFANILTCHLRRSFQISVEVSIMGNSIEISCILILPKKTAFVADSHIDCDQSESNYTFPWCCLNDRCGSLLKYTKEEMPLERLFRLRVFKKIKTVHNRIWFKVLFILFLG